MLPFRCAIGDCFIGRLPIENISVRADSNGPGLADSVGSQCLQGRASCLVLANEHWRLSSSEAYP